MPLVRGDQRRVGLGSEAAGKIERAGSQGTHGISSARSWTRSRPRAATRPDRRDGKVLGSASDYAARPGSCGKPPTARYSENGGSDGGGPTRIIERGRPPGYLAIVVVPLKLPTQIQNVPSRCQFSTSL